MNGATKQPPSDDDGRGSDRSPDGGSPRHLLDSWLPGIAVVREMYAEDLHTRCVDLSHQLVSAEQANAPAQVVAAIQRQLDEAKEKHEDVRFGDREGDR